MEGLVNPHPVNTYNYTYDMNLDEPIISIMGIYFVESEKSIFGIKEKVEKLDSIINEILEVIIKAKNPNDDYIIKTIKEKQNCLKALPIKYKDIKNNFIENDKYYREELFEFYRKSYHNASSFAFSERNKCISIMNDIQRILREKFLIFYDDYTKILDEFFEINNYFIKIKKLYNI